LAELREKGIDTIDGIVSRSDDWLETELKLSKLDLRKLRFVPGQTLPAAAPAKAPSLSSFDGGAPSGTTI